MDPVVTTAIVTAAAIGAIDGTTEVAKTAVGDLYNGLKNLIVRKFGKDSDLVKAVEEVEKKPTKKGRQVTLNEEITDAGADKDKEIQELAEELLKALESKSKAQEMMQNIQQNIGHHAAGSIYGNAETKTIYHK